MDLISENRSFGGRQLVYTHPSETCACDMTFAIYLPPQAEEGPVPVLWYLSGLTCTHENAMTKAGMQQWAAEYGLALVFPDTSPRGEGVADDDAFDLGKGAGFYVNATQEPWSAHYRMYDYITKELAGLVRDGFEVTDRWGITGHSMGGHGALTLAMRNPDLYQSVSAFSPIVNPTASDWGRKQFTAYLGEDETTWQGHDASKLVSEGAWTGDILIDQGLSDQFLDLLKPEVFAAAAAKARVPVTFRTHAGYDHSYFFIASYAEDHVAWAAERLL